MKSIPLHFLKTLWASISHFLLWLSGGGLQDRDLPRRLPSTQATQAELGEPVSAAEDTPHIFPPTTQQINDSIQKFIDSINKEAVCGLTSRFNGGKPCKVINQQHGSFNVCFFVHFEEEDITWVLRIPIGPVVRNVWDKLVSEVTTMRYIKQNTSIPIPSIHAHGKDDTLIDGVSTPFMLMDFIHGQQLHTRTFLHATELQRRNLYTDLIDSLAQLRNLKFPAAGSLMPNPSNEFDPIVGPFLSMAANEFERSGGKPIPAETFTSTRRFTDYHCDILSETCKLPVEELSYNEAKMEIFALNRFLNEVPQRIKLQEPEEFILAHPDLRCGNIIVTDDFHIAGIIDWEFASTIPQQFFIPPSWITGHCRGTLRIMTGIRRCNVFPEFYKVLLEMQNKSSGCAQLWQDWGLFRNMQQSQKIFPMAHILRDPCSLLEMYYYFLFPEEFGFKVRQKEVVGEFLAEDRNKPLVEQVERHFENSKRYTDYLREHDLLVKSDRDRQIQELLEKTKFLVQNT